MSSVQLRSEHARQSDGRDVPRRVASERDNVKSCIPVVPILITLGTVAVAALLAWAMWQAYMGAPWTRDGTVRAYVVTTAGRRANCQASRQRQPARAQGRCAVRNRAGRLSYRAPE